jgi:2,4-dienoyl-CoA reductase-like NADH-dependent reductase (Old Yellow Enzyme family)
MNGPVAAALAGSPTLGAKFEAFRSAAHDALGEAFTAQIHHAVAQVHGMETPSSGGGPTSEFTAALAYARRIPFEHTAITDADAAAVIAEIGEARFVAFSVVAALADAECRAQKVDLAGLTA